MLPQLIPDNFPEKTNTQDKSTLAQFPIAIPLEKVRKPLSILTFSGGIEMEHWLEIVNKLHETEANNKHKNKSVDDFDVSVNPQYVNHIYLVTSSLLSTYELLSVYFQYIGLSLYPLKKSENSDFLTSSWGIKT